MRDNVMGKLFLPPYHSPFKRFPAIVNIFQIILQKCLCSFLDPMHSVGRHTQMRFISDTYK